MIIKSDPLRQENVESARGAGDDPQMAPATGTAPLTISPADGGPAEGVEWAGSDVDEWELPDASGSWAMTAIDDDFDDSDDDDDDDEYDEEDDFYGDDDDFDDDDEADTGLDP